MKKQQSNKLRNNEIWERIKKYEKDVYTHTKKEEFGGENIT